MNHLVVFALTVFAGASSAASITDNNEGLGVNPTLCLIEHCSLQSFYCYRQQDCYDILMCMQKCKDSQSGTCILDCGLEKISNNELFQNLIHCMIENECVPPEKPDGICLAEDSDALSTLTDLETV